MMVISFNGNRLGAARRQGGGVVDGLPAMACGSAEYSWTSNTPQSKDAFSFFSLEAEGATLNKPWEAKHHDTSQSLHPRTQFDLCFWAGRFSLLIRLLYSLRLLWQSVVPTTALELAELSGMICKWEGSSGCRQHGGKLNIVHLHKLPTLYRCKAGWK